METEKLRKSILKIMKSQLREITSISNYLMTEGSRDEALAELLSNISVYAAKSTERMERVRELTNEEDMLRELDTFGKFVRTFELKAVTGMARLGFEIEIAIVAKQ